MKLSLHGNHKEPKIYTNIPCDSTLNNWVKKFDLSFIRSLVSKQLEKKKPKIMAIDATGIVSVGTETRLIYGLVLKLKPR